MKYEYNFDHLILPHKHLKTLRQVAKRNIVIEDYEPLLKLEMIYYHEEKRNKDGIPVPVSKLFHITEKGLCYLQYKKEQIQSSLHDWINSGAAILAILLSIISLVTGHSL